MLDNIDKGLLVYSCSTLRSGLVPDMCAYSLRLSTYSILYFPSRVTHSLSVIRACLSCNTLLCGLPSAGMFLPIWQSLSGQIRVFGLGKSLGGLDCQWNVPGGNQASRGSVRGRGAWRVMLCVMCYVGGGSV